MTRFRDDGPTPDWLTFEEALDRILGAARPLASESARLEDTPGRVLSEPVLAPLSLPPWPNSAMDGFATRAADLGGATEEDPAVLTVVGESLPGSPWDGVLGPGEAVRIMTGGPVPPDADSVIRVEHTDGGSAGSKVRIHSDADRFRHIRPAGEDMSVGDELLSSGTWVGSGQLAVLTGLGCGSVPVHRRPRVAILSTGDELYVPAPGIAPWSEGVPDTNTPTLAQAVREAGCVPIPLGIARDSVDALSKALDLAREARPDVLLTTGGASMGAADLVKDALDHAGYSLDFWRVQIRPGSPFSYGVLPGTPRAGDGNGTDSVHVFGLPGNPVSSFVTFQLLVRPFLLALSGQTGRFHPVVTAMAAEDITGARDLAIFLRVHLDPASPEPLSGQGTPYTARLTGAQGSGLMNSLGRAHGLAVIPRGTRLIEAGESVTVILLGGHAPGLPRVALDR